MFRNVRRLTRLLLSPAASLLSPGRRRLVRRDGDCQRLCPLRHLWLLFDQHRRQVSLLVAPLSARRPTAAAPADSLLPLPLLSTSIFSTAFAGQCSPRQLGYTFNPTILGVTVSVGENYDRIFTTLTKVLVLVPICAFSAALCPSILHR
jgi:hypothetical protein